MVKQTEEIFTN